MGLTGSNASYVEKEENILGVQQDGGESKVGTMVINTEWPDFRSRCLKLLVEDSQLDEVSESPGNRSFEKLTAGLYLGDIARRAFLRYTHLLKRKMPANFSFLAQICRAQSIKAQFVLNMTWVWCSQHMLIPNLGAHISLKYLCQVIQSLGGSLSFPTNQKCQLIVPSKIGLLARCCWVHGLI